MEIRKLIGMRILELRKEKGLSQEALANLAEVDRTYMTGVETGKRNISVQVLLKIIIALGTNYQGFFNHPSFGNTQ
jgi:transcriptional regulator with XRE-family HTH domain